jgi:DNA modification methylase
MLTLPPQLDAIHHCDALDLLRALPDNSIHCVVTSPPYFGLRDYGADGQIGLEDTPAAFVARLVELFEEVWRVLRDDGVCWINLGDSYSTRLSGDGWGDYEWKTGGKVAPAAGTISDTKRTRADIGLPAKNLLGIPWRVALALQDAGWWLRSDIIWAKPNPMPESVTDRPTKAHEYVFLLTKSGQPLFWSHRDDAAQRTQPAPDYRWINRETGEERTQPPPNWKSDKQAKKLWGRVNLWRSHDYWYDADAIREPHKAESLKRMNYGLETDRSRNYPGSAQTLKMGEDAQMCHSAGRNKRTVWTVPTEPSPFKHFAMFPQALIEPMILAGCPETVCSECGAGYVRGVERKANYTQRQDRGQPNGKPPQVDSSGWEPPDVTDHGFTPSCDCNAPPDAGIVLDPFMGSGTTALVAQKHGRHFIGCDVNEDYVKLARDRVLAHGDDKRMVKEQAAGVRQLDLFGDPVTPGDGA